MYIIRRQINKACELACDESVIKKLSAEERQSYGDSLILVVSDQKYPKGVFHATICEEKKGLKERLFAIKNYCKKSKVISVISVILVLSVITSGIVLGNSSIFKYKPDSPIQRIKEININDVIYSRMTVQLDGGGPFIDLYNPNQRNMVVQIINWLRSDSSSISDKTNIHGIMYADPWKHIELHFKDNTVLDLSYYKGHDPDGEITITGTFIGDNQIQLVEKSSQIAELLSGDWKKYFGDTSIT